MSTNVKAAYSVEVIGFNQTERIVLSSIFGLSARREPKFLQHTTVAYAPDLYLVDGADTQAVALFKARNATQSIPAIIIGDSSHGTPFPVLARPLQWTKLFKAFDLAIASRPQRLSTPAFVVPAAPVAPISPAQNVMAAPAPAPSHDMRDQIADRRSVQTRTQPMATIPNATPMPLPTSAPATIQTSVTRTAQTEPSIAPNTLRQMPPQVTPPVNATPTQNNRDWVLVVDDNITAREFMKTKLAPFGFNVDYAESGEQAIGLTGQKSYSCVFLDVIMPGIDGYQVCKLIKSKRAATKTAVIMLTSKGSPFDRIRGAMAGCDAYLTKPVDEDKLLESIVKFLPVATH